MRIVVGKVALFAAASLFVACGKDDKDGEGGLTKWKGAEAHIQATGTLNGEAIDFDIPAAEAGDASTFVCVREYEVPLVDGELDYSAGNLVEVKINGLFTVAGEQRRLELELKRYNFQAASAGTRVEVVPRIETEEPGAGNMWLEWEWHTADEEDIKTYEEAAQEGHFILGEFTGEVGADGLTIPDNDGVVGGFLTASWSETEEVVMSFTVKCGENKITEVE